MQQALETLQTALTTVLGKTYTLYLYGSVALHDFQPGWSDIDLLCLTREPPRPSQAEQLVNLRQALWEQEPENPWYRCFEGAIAALPEFQAGAYTRLVYWGTSGQRITDQYRFDAFCQYQLLHHGILLHGPDVRPLLTPPTQAQLRDEVRRHYTAIRQYAAQTGPSLYSCGWLLDIARGLYTLRCGGIIAKTAAGDWALREGLCPVADDLRRTLQVRRAPKCYASRPETKQWLAGLGPSIQRFADVLAQELSDLP